VAAYPDIIEKGDGKGNGFKGFKGTLTLNFKVSVPLKNDPL